MDNKLLIIPKEYIERFKVSCNKVFEEHPNAKKFNMVIHFFIHEGGYVTRNCLIFKGNINSELVVGEPSKINPEKTNIDFKNLLVKNKSDGYILTSGTTTHDGNMRSDVTVKYISDYNELKYMYEGEKQPVIPFSSLCPISESEPNKFLGFKGTYPQSEWITPWVNMHKTVFELSMHPDCSENGEGLLPPLNPNEGEQSNTTCSNTGQFGGGGTPLKDIKLFLYANNVTKGTIKLSKPQVEVGTFATDWRPNPSDYVERNSPAYKEIKGLAIQHNKEQNKKYIEVQATDGTVYGVDIWGGDAQKLLEQQQAEIEELKKLVQTLETKINV